MSKGTEGDEKQNHYGWVHKDQASIRASCESSWSEHPMNLVDPQQGKEKHLTSLRTQEVKGDQSNSQEAPDTRSKAT